MCSYFPNPEARSKIPHSVHAAQAITSVSSFLSASPKTEEFACLEVEEYLQTLVFFKKPA